MILPLELCFIISDYLSSCTELRLTCSHLYRALDSEEYWQYKSTRTFVSPEARILASKSSWKKLFSLNNIRLDKDRFAIYHNQGLAWDITGDVWVLLKYRTSDDLCPINLRALGIEVSLVVSVFRHTEHGTAFVLFITSDNMLRILFIGATRNQNFLIRKDVASASFDNNCNLLVIVTTDGKAFVRQRPAFGIFLTHLSSGNLVDDYFLSKNEFLMNTGAIGPIVTAVITGRGVSSIILRLPDYIYLLAQDGSLYRTTFRSNPVLIHEKVISIHKREHELIIVKDEKIIILKEDLSESVLDGASFVAHGLLFSLLDIF